MNSKDNIDTKDNNDIKDNMDNKDNKDIKDNMNNKDNLPIQIISGERRSIFPRHS